MQPSLKNDLLYLLNILEASEKIFLYSDIAKEAISFFELHDGLEFNACLMQLIQIGEQTGKISHELKGKHTECDWNQMKGFRNRAVHDYTGLDRFIIFDIIKSQMPLLNEQVCKIIKEELSAGSFDEEEFFIAQTSPYLKHVNFRELSD